MCSDAKDATIETAARQKAREEAEAQREWQRQQVAGMVNAAGLGGTIGYAQQAETRMDGRSALREHARQLILSGERLLRLANALPAEMNHEAEMALRDLVGKAWP